MTWKRNTEGGFASYLDGKRVEARKSADSSIPKLDANVAILDFSDEARRNNNSFDEVRIWNIARTAEQIQHYQYVRAQGNEDGLLGCWRFYNGQAKDFSTHGRNGKLSGFSGSPQVETSPLSTYTVHVGVGGRRIRSKSTFAANTWQHLAAVYHQAHAIQFDGNAAYLDCGNNRTLDLCRDLTVEVFFTVKDLTQARGLLTKGKIDDGTDDDVS